MAQVKNVRNFAGMNGDVHLISLRGSGCLCSNVDGEKLFFLIGGDGLRIDGKEEEIVGIARGAVGGFIGGGLSVGGRGGIEIVVVGGNEEAFAVGEEGAEGETFDFIGYAGGVTRGDVRQRIGGENRGSHIKKE